MQTSTQQNKFDLESLLHVLSLATKQISEDASHSLKMRQHGLNTAMARDLEKALSNPVAHLLEFGTRVNIDILKVLSETVRLYFKEKSELIDAAYEEEGNPLHFFIILKEDNAEHRNDLNEFFDLYYLEDYSDRFPIIFTYTTSERAARVNGLQTLNLDE